MKKSSVTGTVPTVITEDWQSEEFRSYFSDWSSSVMAANELKKSRIAVFGRMKGMGDIINGTAFGLRLDLELPQHFATYQVGKDLPLLVVLPVVIFIKLLSRVPFASLRLPSTS